ncbi:unnamed protein product [Haemonchus placei]|uniref:DDE Tnp4 domain-containing protein n=1 Tax=Haemonchus placei TaxID=6290 RepID=A0A0N4W1D2_HAEPC|nr:unnamed protein product [Haemonchus placei]
MDETLCRSLNTSINLEYFATLASEWEDSAIDNINEEHNRFVKHLHNSARKAERLQRGIARTTCNHQQTSELAKLCRKSVKEVLKERRAAGKSIHKAWRSFANNKTKVLSLRRHVLPDPDLFDNHIYLHIHQFRGYGYVAPSVLPSEIRHAITAMKYHLKNLPPVIVRTLARLFTRYLCAHVRKTSKTVMQYKKVDPDDTGNYRPICLLIGRVLQGQPYERAGFRRGFTFETLKTEAVIESLGNQGFDYCLCIEGLKGMGVKVDNRYSHHFRFAGGIVLITPNIEQAERMLAGFDRVYDVHENGLVPNAPFTSNGTCISECSSYVYLDGKKRAAWVAFKYIEEEAKKTKNIQLRAHLFNTAVLPALTYASETWILRKQDERISLYTQVQKGAPGSANKSKIRPDTAVTEWTPWGVKRAPGRPPIRWSHF